MTEQVQNGTMQAHSREWPLCERQVFTVEVVGHLDFNGHHISEQGLKASMESGLREILEPWGVKVSIEPMILIEMSPKDQAEAYALDEAAIRN